MKKALFILICILFLFSCNKPEETLAGLYKSGGINLYELPSFILSGFDDYSIGAKLQLNINKSFKYTTCGNIMTGNWNQKNDSLFLFVTKSMNRADSLYTTELNENISEISKRFITFNIKPDLLVSQNETLNGKKVLNKLIKINQQDYLSSILETE